MSLLDHTFAEAAPYGQFVAAMDPEHRPAWDQRHGQLELDDAQKALVGSFARSMRLLCLTGPWCGDCALQGSAMARIAAANPERVDLRFIVRSEEHAELIVANRINGGFRVPLTFLLAEDGAFVARFGDRTLSRYRSMARKILGDAANVHAPPPEDPVREVLREVLDEFERVQLLLRLSPRLREKHGD
jgi:hypothetical protein